MSEQPNIPVLDVTEFGFESHAEFSRMVCSVNLTDPLGMADFKSWQHLDGSKTGLQAVIDRNPRAVKP